MSEKQLLLAIACCAAITFAIRAFPFLLRHVARKHDRLFTYLGEVMPPGIMAILAIYCVVTLRWQTSAQAGVSILAIVVLMILQHRFRAPVSSICIALAIYVCGQSLLAG